MTILSIAPILNQIVNKSEDVKLHTTRAVAIGLAHRMCGRARLVNPAHPVSLILFGELFGPILFPPTILQTLIWNVMELT